MTAAARGMPRDGGQATLSRFSPASKVEPHLDHAAARRRDEHADRRGPDPDLVVSVGVDVARFRPRAIRRREAALRRWPVVPDVSAQERQVQPAEDAVPVGIVALRPADGAPDLGADRPVRDSRCESASMTLCIRLLSGYLTRKCRQWPPRSNPPSTPSIRAPSHSRSSRSKRARRFERQRPSFHLAIRCGREVGETARRRRGEGILESGQPHLVVVPQLAHGAEKRLQPAVLVQPFPRAGPAAELLAVVAQNRELAAAACGARGNTRRVRTADGTERGSAAFRRWERPRRGARPTP